MSNSKMALTFSLGQVVLEYLFNACFIANSEWMTLKNV